MSYEAVIGLEVHCQLSTESKIFSGSSAAFGGEPNSHVDPVCLGLPGVLPVLNKTAVIFAIKTGLAMNCRIAGHSVFARKNYFYPDLPKGYQISQFDEPLCEHGYLEIQDGNESRRIGITRIHLEEDAGKSIHAESFVKSDETLVDVNRCGVPLVEIVGEPDIRTPREANLYLTELRQIVRYLGVCDGNMEEGSLRCDANISVRPAGQKELGVKTELKNMNSIRGVERALEFEIARQVKILEEGGSIQQETLLWNANTNEAAPMRSKEYSHDYRYFPEPDLVPLSITDEWIADIENSLPELPSARRRRLAVEYGVPEYDAAVLTDNQALADYYEEVARAAGDGKAASNWVMGEVLGYLNEHNLNLKDLKVTSENLAALLKLVAEGTISGKIAKTVFAEMASTGEQPDTIVAAKGLVQISDSSEITGHVQQVLADNPTEVEKFLAGKEQVVGFLVGQVMRATCGKANPKLVNQTLRDELQRLRK